MIFGIFLIVFRPEEEELLNMVFDYTGISRVDFLKLVRAGYNILGIFTNATNVISKKFTSQF